MKNIIQIQLEAKEDNEILDIRSDDLTKWNNLRKKSMEELFEFIEKRVHPKSRKELNRLIENYCNNYSEKVYYENILYYKSGFSDEIKIIITSIAT